MRTMIATSLFQDPNATTSVISQLEYAGLSEVDIALFTHDGTDRTWDQGGLPEGSGDRFDRIAGWLQDQGIPSDDAHAYAEGVRRSGSLVAVRCNEINADNIVSILDSGLDIDEHQSSWRASGWQPGRGEVTPGTEARLRRDIGHGRVRLYDRIVSR